MLVPGAVAVGKLAPHKESDYPEALVNEMPFGGGIEIETRSPWVQMRDEEAISEWTFRSRCHKSHPGS